LGSYGSYYNRQEEIRSGELVETQDDFLADTSILNEDRDYE
jgi:hypothetical protein